MNNEERLKELERMFQALLDHLGLYINYVPDRFEVCDPKNDEVQKEGDEDEQD